MSYTNLNGDIIVAVARRPSKYTWYLPLLDHFAKYGGAKHDHNSELAVSESSLQPLPDVRMHTIFRLQHVLDSWCATAHSRNLNRTGEQTLFMPHEC